MQQQQQSREEEKAAETWKGKPLLSHMMEGEVPAVVNPSGSDEGGHSYHFVQILMWQWGLGMEILSLHLESLFLGGL